MKSEEISNRRIAKNTAYLYGRMFLGLLVALYTCRVVLQVLGVVDYGINSVVGGFVIMFAFLNNTLSSSLQRFYNYESVTNGDEGFCQVYNTGLLIHCMVALILLIVLETFGFWYVNNIMVIPKDRLFAANIVYQSSIISMMLVILQIPYSGAIMAKERMNYFAGVGIFDIVTRLLFVFLLPYMPIDKLIAYAGFSLLISVLNFLLYYIYCKKEFLEMKLRKVKEKSLYKSILSFSGWNLLGTLAFMMKSQGVNMMLNYCFGPIINAARSIAYQINSAIGNFSSNIVIAFRPQLVNSYAVRNYERTRYLMFMESKSCFLLISALIVPFIFEVDLILSLWLGKDIVPNYTASFTVLILIDNLINTLNTPCTQVVHAVGKLRNYQIVSSIINFILLPVCWILLKIGLDATTVYIAMIIISIIHQSACVIITNNVFNFGIRLYIKQVVFPCISSLLLLITIPFIIFILLPESLYRLLLILFFDLLMACIVGYFIMLGKEEKELVKQIIRSKNIISKR